ncbi:MAG TPA: phage tail tape measure protein [Devosiaceae bacterium]|nr:phage tail tape measure protein [Devosiaceae bacterium]
MADSDPLFSDGFSTELSGVSTQLGQINSLAGSVSRSITSAFRSAAVDGKSLNNVLGDIALSFSNIALKAALQPVSQLISGFVSNLFTATNPTLGGVTAFAKGGVIASPTYFPMGSGTGLAGEAGPEAIMPLVRGADGSLGVAGAGGGAVTVNFNVSAPDAKSFAASEAEVSAMLLRAVRRGTRGS